MSTPGYSAVWKPDESITIIIDGQVQRTIQCDGPEHLKYVRLVSAVKEERPRANIESLLNG